MVESKKIKLVAGRVYEVGYLLSPMIPAESLVEQVEKNLKEAITTLDGQIVSEVSPRHINLAYPMKKNVEHRRLTFREAFFGALRFEALPQSVVELKKKLTLVPDLIRCLVIEIPKAMLLDEERAIARVNHPPRQPVSTDVVISAEATASSEAEIDKQIDQLLTTESYVSK